jgi:hypothetical protein
MASQTQNIDTRSMSAVKKFTNFYKKNHTYSFNNISYAHRIFIWEEENKQTFGSM